MKNKSRNPSRQEMEQLTAFLPLLNAPGFEPIKIWRGSEKLSNGTITFPWPEYEQVVVNFFGAAGNDTWCDYGYDPATAARMLQDHDLIKKATIAQIKTMLTYCVRGERFCDGHWAAVIGDGSIRRLLERLVELSQIQ